MRPLFIFPFIGDTFPMNERIRKSLLAIGMPSVPTDPNENLEDHGLDSLMMVLAVAQLEKEFAIKIPGSKVEEANFSTIAQLAQLVEELSP